MLISHSNFIIKRSKQKKKTSALQKAVGTFQQLYTLSQEGKGKNENVGQYKETS
jgi:hypothetical protein